MPSHPQLDLAVGGWPSRPRLRRACRPGSRRGLHRVQARLQGRTVAAAVAAALTFPCMIMDGAGFVCGRIGHRGGTHGLGASLVATVVAPVVTRRPSGAVFMWPRHHGASVVGRMAFVTTRSGGGRPVFGAYRLTQSSPRVVAGASPRDGVIAMLLGAGRWDAAPCATACGHHVVRGRCAVAVSTHEAGRGNFTGEDLRHTRDDGKRYEVLEGDLIVSRSPKVKHQVLVGILHEMLYRAQRAGCGQVLLAPTWCFPLATWWSPTCSLSPGIAWLS